MVDIYYEDVQFGKAIHALGSASAEMAEVGNTMRAATGGELGPPALEQAVAEAANRWTAGAVKLAAAIRGVATQINEEIAAYQGMETRAQEMFAQIVSGRAIDERELPNLPTWDREQGGPEDAEYWREVNKARREQEALDW